MKKMIRLNIIFSVAGLFSLYTTAIAQSTKTAAAKIDSIFASYNSQTPGTAVAVVKDGKVIFKKGYGMANLSNNIPITPQTVFNLASVSKQFTAFAIYLLESEGKISFEDDVRKYLPELPDFGKVIKIRHLLAHTSGIRDQWALLALSGFRMDDVITTEQIMKLLVRQKGMNVETGSAFNYSNSNATLLAEIIHRVSGVSFAEYTMEKIFKPLGMASTQFYDNHERIVKKKAESYELDKGVYYHKLSNVSNVGPSNLLTTVEDLSRWVLNFERPIVGDTKLINAFNEPSYLDNGKKVVTGVVDGDTIFHAKGQNLRKHKGVQVISHGGHTAGFRTFLGRFPDQRLSIIQLSNDEHSENLGGRWNIADYYIKEHLVEKKQTTSSAISTAIGNATTVPAQNVVTVSLNEFSGKYFSDELDTRYYLEVTENKLIMKHIRLDDIVLKCTAENKFLGNGPNTFAFEINFVRNTSGEVTGFEISNWGAKNLRFIKQE
jgi:CubicO group peptidase (beta-lactamase class C family)